MQPPYDNSGPFRPDLREPLRFDPPVPPPRLTPGWRRKMWLHALLFLATFCSALLSQVPVTRDEGFFDLLTIPFLEPARLVDGLPFAVTLMTILLAHEMGHFLTALRYGVDQSLPYFIPAPTLFGTLGAVILMRSQPANRRVLLKVAVMGPYAGLALAIPAAAWGLHHSLPLDPMQPLPPGLMFGDSLLFSWLETAFSPAGADVILHPVGMAGWVGLFITSLNLIPAAQLDGGHVAYALFGEHQVKLSLLVVVGLLTLGLSINLLGTTGHGGEMWILWAMLLFIIGIKHPPVQDEAMPLTFAGKLNGFVALLVFVVTFIPVPVQMLQGDDEAVPAEPRLEGESDDRGAPMDDGGRMDDSRRSRRPHDGDEPAQPGEEYKL